jgi:hypothetical protein
MRLYWISVGLILVVMPSAIAQPLPQSLASLVVEPRATILNEPERALEYYQQALEIARKSSDSNLWSVNDDSTSQLMQQFYSNLAKSTERSPITKAEALRQAQLALLKNPSLTKTNANRTVLHPNEANQETRRDNQPSAPGFTHPY